MPNMSPKSNRPQAGKPPENTRPGLDGKRVVESQDLLGAGEQVLIRHEGRVYCLRRTRLGKLILTA
jgi:hemin uptake protein HemP